MNNDYEIGFSDGYRRGTIKERQRIKDKVSRFILYCIEVCCMLLLYLGILVVVAKCGTGFLPIFIIPLNLVLMIATHIIFSELRGECND